MATDYATLKTEIADWTHRSDLTTKLDTFIDMAEAKMSRNLRMSEMENSTSVAVTTADLSLPAGFVEMREIHISGSPDTILEYLTPYQFEQNVTTESGKPRYYTIIADAIKLFPAGAYTVVMNYYKTITPLDDTNTTNFVITTFPDLYLHGTLQQAFIYAQDAQAATLHGQEFMRLTDEINKMSRRRKFSGAPLQVVAA